MKTIVIVVNFAQQVAIEAARLLETYCAQTVGLESYTLSASAGAAFEADDLRVRALPLVTPEDITHADLIVALGGDGTLLRSIHLLSHVAAPVLGIKYGRLGFLAGAAPDEIIPAVEAALAGTALRESRTLLEVCAYAGETEIARGFALNEAVLGRHRTMHMVDARVLVNGKLLYATSGDGLILATATGSTAYALSAGGPILSPEMRGLVVLPLASHSLLHRAVITTADDVLRIELTDSNRGGAELVLDGNAMETSSAFTALEARVSERHIDLVKLESRSFYEVLAHEFFGEK